MFKPQIALLITALACSSLLAAPPVRKFDDPGAPPFKVLKEGENPPLDANDNFVVGPKYVPAPERKKVDGVPEGKVEQFVIDSKETKLFNPGIARNEFGKVDPSNPKTLIVETHNIDYKRKITVYIPSQYQGGNASPFQVIHDGPGGRPNAELLHIFDNLIAQKRIPPIIVIWIANGGGDAQGHERGKEYDNMNGDYAEYIETEVLPRVEKNTNLKLTKDPTARAAMGNSSGGSAALIMAWFRTDLYHRVLTTSGTFVNQAWPVDPRINLSATPIVPDGGTGKTGLKATIHPTASTGYRVRVGNAAQRPPPCKQHKSQQVGGTQQISPPVMFSNAHWHASAIGDADAEHDIYADDAVRIPSVG